MITHQTQVGQVRVTIRWGHVRDLPDPAWKAAPTPPTTLSAIATSEQKTTDQITPKGREYLTGMGE